MFENLVNQEAVKLLISDITKEVFPGAVLFSGNDNVCWKKASSSYLIWYSLDGEFLIISSFTWDVKLINY